jgi:hypothetical protein
MNNQVALFKISKAFYILSIGQIIAGQVLEGQIVIGNLIEVIINDAIVLFSVKALECISAVSRNTAEVGIRVEPVNVTRPLNFETYAEVTVPVFQLP